MKKIILLAIILTLITLSACAQVDPNQATNEFGEGIEINMRELQPTMPIILQEGQEAILLSEFIALKNPNDYTYRIVASDGYSPAPFNYSDIENGYWLLDIDETFFPDNNFGRTRIREPTTIIPLAKE